MSKRPRTSSIVLTAVFLGVLALYFLVRPASAPGAQPTGTQTPVPSAPSPARSPGPARSPRPSRSATPSASATPSPSATPSGPATLSPSPSAVSGSPGAAPTSSSLP